MERGDFASEGKMETFVWDQRFMTGLPTVDEQHRHLVEIINRVGDMLLAAQVSETELQAIFKELADYARYHFAEEEKLMDATSLDHRFTTPHQQHHAQFVDQLLQMWRARTTLEHPAEMLHGFLTAWLSFHILDEDQSMARQIASVTAGNSAEKAYDLEQQGVDNNVATLLGALHRLYHVLSLQNRALAHANQGLEAKVTQRTQALTASNEKLTDLVKTVESAQSQLLQSEKMAAVGQLAAGVAHEINNPIGFVTSNLGTLKSYVTDLLDLIAAHEAAAAGDAERLVQVQQKVDIAYLRQDVIALLTESSDGLERVRKIVQDLKDFSHVDEAEWQDANLNAGLDSTLNVVNNEIKYKAEVIKDYAQLPLVRCIPGQLNQVFMNLLVNAAQAIKERGSITVRTEVKDGMVCVAISDTGCGMAPEVVKRVFEPFYTTKPVGTGTGLGLSLAYDIVVKKHGGRIEVDSTPGRGTTFTISLPLEKA
jgi:hemerythrin-like metal-binding protein